MPDVTVSKVLGSREWAGKDGGKFVSYKIELEELEGVHELTQKPETPAPTEGLKFFGEVHPPNREGFPNKIKKKQQNFGGGGRNGHSPEERESIQRQTSAKVTAQLLADKQSLDTADKLVAAFNKLFDAVHAKVGG